MQAHCYETLFECSTPDELAEFVASWEQSFLIANDLPGEAKASCGYIEAHLTGKKQRNAKEERDAEKKRQHAAILKVKQDAKSAADKIRAARNPPAKPPADTMPIFLAAWDEIDNVTTVVEIPSKDAADVWDIPFAVDKHNDMMLLMGNSSLQKELAAWVSDFRQKLEPRGQKILQGSGKDDGSGLNEATGFFEKWQPPHVDVSSVEGGSSFMNSIWKVGYKGGMEVLATGRVRGMFIKADTLFQAFNGEGCPESPKQFHVADSKSAIIEKISKMGATTLKDAKAAGVSMRK
ncbi:unnamed protein product, partial [Prorocentrum cordatum]